jgi:AraC-like DNA-binding protein
VPWAGAVAIVCFGVPYRLDGEPFDAFVGGLSDRPILTEFVGAAGGVQIDFTPLGARRCLGLPMDELTNRVVDLEDVLGPGAPLLAERLQEAPGWAERFALLDAALLRRVEAGPEPAPEVAWTFRRLAEAHGRLAVGPLAAEVGWSRRHLAARWRRDVGLGPKAVARILRFERAHQLVRGGRGLADVAYECGYADQSHLNRDFRALAGATPREVTFVQDAQPGPV